MPLFIFLAMSRHKPVALTGVVNNTHNMIAYLPPIQALRAFEAAARHLSYSRAAEELALTHGAISHHISRLEYELGGVRLFIRVGQRMLLTEAGQLLVLDVRAGLHILSDGMAAANARGRPKKAPTMLTISVLPSFAVRWLVPRLSKFQSAYPNIDIAVRPTAALSALDGCDGVDLAIRYGPGHWPGLMSERLLKSFVFPVCSPQYLAKLNLESEGSVLGAHLLRNPRQKWRPWFAAAGLDASEPLTGPVYDDAGLLLQAAADGQGVALARYVLAADDLASGRLVRVSTVSIEDEYSWFIVWREPLRCEGEEFDRFKTWLLHEALNERVQVV